MKDKIIALNYIYLSPKHAGGKDQVGLNLLKGFQENGYNKNQPVYVFCYEHSSKELSQIAPEAIIVPIRNLKGKSELARMVSICIDNTLIIPKLIKKYSVDVIYHLSCNNGIKKLKTKTVVIPHDIKAIAHRHLPGLIIPFSKYIMYKIMYEMDFKHADVIIAISEEDKKDIRQFYPRYSEKVKKIYNPIDMQVCKKYNTERRNEIVAINIQFLHKNTITLIKAFEVIMNDIEENLILVGNVPDRVAFLKKYVEDNNLSERVIFTDFIPSEERNEVLHNCRLYVNPTLFEGFGMVAVEAIISGVPALISKIPTNYEITKGLCNYYEPAEDYLALAEALKRVLKEKPKAEEMVEKAETLFDTYNYKKISDKYYRLFMDLIS